MVRFIAKHDLYVHTVLLTILGATAAAIGELSLVTPRTGPAGDGLALIGALAAIGAVFAVGFTLMARAERFSQDELENELSTKYGVTLRQVGGGVWEVGGELRQATLTVGNTLLVGGRELARAAG